MEFLGKGVPKDISEDLAARLPPPRDDEPASLRQEIFDELRDHLKCSVRREQLRGANDDQTAWQRVLARFGDPQEIARKLYWQAIWSRVMKQRIVMAGGAGMLAIGIAIVALLWVMLDRQQQLVARQQAWAEQQQANFELMLAKVNAPPNVYGSLKVHVDRPARVGLSGGSLKDEMSFNDFFQDFSWKESNVPREFDCGDLTPGRYTLGVYNDHWSNQRQILIRSGAMHHENVTFPSDPSAAVTLVIATNLPETWQGSIPVEVEWNPISVSGRRWEPAFLTRDRDALFTVGDNGNTSTIEVHRFGAAKLRFRYGRTDGRFYHPHNHPVDHAEYIVAVDLKPGQNSCKAEFPPELVAIAKPWQQPAPAGYAPASAAPAATAAPFRVAPVAPH